jgi:16S rRNA (adenine1518-N6/adenine1519-N6)-dimethyltransferase
MSARQTQSYLRSLFTQRGISPQRRLGQNFLIDLNIHDLIVKEAAVGPGDVVLEVGSGTGALTALMAGRGAVVVAVDVDPAMARLTVEAAAELPGVRVLERDALANKNTLSPEVLDNVRAGLAGGPGRRFKVVANLPYHIATPVISNLLVHPELCPELMVVTIQREMAERLCAGPATAAYGAVSIVVQALADVAIVRSLPPSVFWPRPKVDSAVVAIRPDAVKRAGVGEVRWFHDLVRRVFLHRRKYLRHALAGIWRDRWTKSEVDAWLESQGLSGQIRAETLSVEEFVELARALRERWGGVLGASGGTTEDEEVEEAPTLQTESDE